MDSITEWVLEALLREPTVDDYTITSLLKDLPLPNDSYRLVKSILLRPISAGIINGSVSKTTLEILEMIEKCDYLYGLAPLDSMKEAYCAVAVHCTLMCLKENPDNMHSYFDVVVRIWRADRREGFGLISERLKDTQSEIEEALWDADVRGELLKRDTLNNALDALRVFVADAIEKMGPCMKKEVHITFKNLVDDQTEVTDVCSSNVCRDMASGSDTAMDSWMEVTSAAATHNFNAIASPEVKKEQEEELMSSAFELLKAISAQCYFCSKCSSDSCI